MFGPLPAAIGFFLLFVSVLLKLGDVGWVKAVLDDVKGSAELRRLLPCVTGFTFALDPARVFECLREDRCAQGER